MKKIKLKITVDGGIIQDIISNTPGVEVVVVDYDSAAYVEDVDNPKNYDPEHNEDSPDVYGTASVALWEDIPVSKGPMWKNFEINEESIQHSDIQERYVRDKLKEWNF
jgi:hypothetical protein